MDTQPRTYRKPLWMRATVLIGMAPLLLGMIIISSMFMVEYGLPGIRSGQLWAVFLTLPLGLSTLGCIWMVWHGVFADRLVVDSDGISFYGYGFKGYTGWQNLDHFGYGILNRRFYWGIGFAQPVSIDANWLVRLAGESRTFEETLPLQYWVNVPKKSIFSHEVDLERFKQTSFGQVLLFYAPNLFEDMK